MDNNFAISRRESVRLRYEIGFLRELQPAHQSSGSFAYDAIKAAELLRNPALAFT